MVSAWAVENEIVLGQRKVDEKSNEITAIPELLKILSIAGCIVTIDAMGTQTNIAKSIVQANADYVLSVKENQGHLLKILQPCLQSIRLKISNMLPYSTKRQSTRDMAALRCVNAGVLPILNT